MANGALDQQAAGPQGPQQGPPQGQQGEVMPQDIKPEMQGEENPDLFPANKKEVLQFATQVVDVLYDDDEKLKQIVQTIVQANTIEEGISQVVAMILAKMLISIRQKTKRDINMSFVDDIAVLLISEMYTLLKAAGEINTPPNKSTLPRTVKDVMDKLKEMLVRGMQAQQQQEAQGGPQGQQPPQGQGQPQQPQGPPQGGPQPSALGA